MKWPRLALTYVVVILSLVFFLFPVYWVLSTSLKTEVQAFSMPPVWWFKPTLENYRAVVTGSYLRSFLNSLIVSAGSIAISLLIGTPAAYALSRFDFKRKKDLAFWILSTRMAPAVGVALPMFLFMKFFKLIDTHFSLIILYITFNLSFVIWMMRGFFEEIPKELDESGLVDGCSPFKAFTRIVMPLAAPGLVATAIFCFIFSWNEFFFALVMTRTATKTIPVAIAGYIGIYGIRWGEMSAAALIGALPIIIFASLVQKHLVRGLTLGAVK
ncbi:MAG: carbohydrate ABC transporter permease [Firmicutes bacterium]|nr:carbohydrate ABC transporter permease [Bacillota bacterium]